jgi:large subunit ribosomal protein L25
MATNATLGAEKREGTGKGVARKLRQAGRVPVVLYGRELDAMHLSVDAREAEHLFHSISVDNTIVALKVKGEKEPYETLVREIQTHPWKANLLHVDFLRIQAGVAVDVDVPIDLIGVPIGVKLDGGTLEQNIHELAVRCIPSKIPDSIRVDVSEMKVNDVLHVYDIKLDEGIELTISADQTICSVAPPRVEETAAPAEGDAAAAAGAEPAGEGDAKDRDD